MSTQSAKAAAAPIDLDYRLEDRYRREDGRVYLTGIQALTRIPMVQKRLDQAMGLNTAGFISGYRGSPLGGFDLELTRSRKVLDDHKIIFKPGLNEDLGATAVWGTQQLDTFEGATVDGVFAMWYGKGPGVDRCGDVFHHAAAYGAAKNGGVLIVMGDDHNAQSSTIPHQSEPMLIGFGMPIFNPASVKELVDYGIAGFHLSRYAGAYIGFKSIAETVESAASIDVSPMNYRFVTPDDFEMPPRGLNFDPTLKWPEERREIEKTALLRIDAIRAWTRANSFDTYIYNPPSARIGIVTTGKATMDVMQFLQDFRIDEQTAERLGLRIYKVGVSWPLEPEGIKRFAKGLDRILVVEEKAAIVEDQIRNILYHLPAAERPVVIGKVDEKGAPLLPQHGELSPDIIGAPAVHMLSEYAPEGIDLDARLAELRRGQNEKVDPAPIGRVPFYCSGCPHNTSTVVPEGSKAMGGIGCHIMALSMDRNTQLYTHMGGEGANWIGMAPFTEREHVFQNLGDGTYEHSGSLAIRAAIHAGVNITYKILYNDAVAMTGGQPIAGQLTVPAIIRQMQAEGVRRIAVVGEHVDEDGAEHYGMAPNPAHGLSFHHRDDLESVQRDLRQVKGVSVLVYDQTCASEKRRRRKRGTMDDPDVRIVINDLVCEGCGDCSAKSNCVSVEPLETELGRKRRINQSSCNKDTSCVKGFCPSFVTVKGGSLRRPEKDAIKAREADLFGQVPDPELPTLSGDGYNILVTGVGGTGVITIGALISMAAHLESKGTTVLDFTGLAQKNGAVMSHVRIAPTPDDLTAVRIAEAQADLLLGCDMVVAGSADALSRVGPERTRIVVNTHEAPTAAFTLDTTVDFPTLQIKSAIRRTGGEGRTEFVTATDIAQRLFGDAIATNLFMLGYAYQRGLIPLSAEAIDRAIELNGVAIDMNRRTFQWGRVYAHNPEAVVETVGAADPLRQTIARTLAEVIDRRAEHLTGYQDTAYARRYRALVERVREAETSVAPGSEALTLAAARFYFKLLAYKDEYEVARLHTDGSFDKRIAAQFTGDYQVDYNMAPPIFSQRDPVTGHLRKNRFSGRWMRPVLKLLASLKGLRGTRWDIFGYTEERQMERRLITDYEATVNHVLAGLTADKLDLATALLSIPDDIRGFGHVKEANFEKAKAKEQELLAQFDAAEAPRQAAE